MFDDELAQVARNVPARLRDYATRQQVEQAVAELTAFRTGMGEPIREAVAAARTVLPGYGKPRRGADGLGYAESLDALTPEARTLINAADRLRDRRQYLGRVIKSLRGGEVPPRYVRNHAGPVEAPTFEGIIARYERAVEWAVADFTAARTTRLPDDDAWQRELDRRAQVEEYLQQGPLMGGSR
ncbi:MAG TPA: hypothetical protein VJT31_24580, partial [Rugosimonospora sp.]|nr:hypothetical protein [Rugosimonospora sp.]